MPRYDLDRLDHRDPEWIRRVHEYVVPMLKWYFRPEVTGIDRIPSGAGLYVGNHNGGMLSLDTFTFLDAVYEASGMENIPYGLAHEVALSFPVLNDLMVPLGAVRASHEMAHRAFEAGHKVMVYPGSDYDAFRSYWDRHRVVFGPRRGYLRLALRERVPIIPVVTAGSHEMLIILTDGQWLARRFPPAKWVRAKAWPISLTIPWGLTLIPPLFYIPRRVRFFQEVLEPIRFEKDGPEAAADPDWVEVCHRRVVDAMQAGMDRLAERQKRS